MLFYRDVFAVHVSRKKETKTAKFWIPIWARRKSSAYNMITLMQQYNTDMGLGPTEGNPLQYESDVRISAFELPAISIPQNQQASFRSAVDSFMLDHMDSLKSVKSTCDVDATRYDSRSHRCPFAIMRHKYRQNIN